MGRRRVEMKKIEDKSSRQVTFAKRRKGLLKKAADLSVLCEANVAVIVFSNRGKLYDFCSAHSFPDMLERYTDCTEERSKRSTCEAENGDARLASIEKCAELLQMFNRNLEGTYIDNLSVTELVKLEKQLDDALKEISSRKTQLLLESISTLREKEKMLLEEIEMLQKEAKIASLKKDVGQDTEEEMMNPISNELNNLRQFTTLSLLH